MADPRPTVGSVRPTTSPDTDAPLDGSQGPGSMAPHDDTVVHRSFVTRIATTAAENWLGTLGLWLAIVALGLLAYVGGLAREGFPSISLPIAIVDGVYIVDDAELVDAEVSGPLTETYLALDEVESVQSYTRSDGFLLFVQLTDGTSSTDGVELLGEATSGVDLPEGALAFPRPVDAGKFLEVYDVLIAVTGPSGVDPTTLQSEADSLAEHLGADPRIASAEVRNLLTEVLDATTGTVEVRQTAYSHVSLGPGEVTDGVVVGLVRNEGAGLDVLGFNEVVEGLLADAPLAEGYTATNTADFAFTIRSQIGSLTSNLLTGLIAVAIVSLLLIGWRTAVVTVAFMTTVMLGALAGLWLMGYSLNTITLFALILTLGLLVDDAIVISESLDSNRDVSDDPITVVRTAINRVGAASLSGTLTTVLVFAPLLFVTGILGAFIRAIPATVMLTLVLSFLFSVVFIPAVAGPFLLKGVAPHNPVTKAERAIGRLLGKLAEYPSSHGLKGVAVGAGVVVFALGVIASSFAVASTLGFSVFPAAKDADALLIDISYDPGTTLAEAEAVADEVDAAMLEVLGQDLVRAQYIVGNDRRTLSYVDLVPFAKRDTKAPVYVERLTDAVADIDGGRITVAVSAMSPPSEEFPFAVQIDVDDDTVDAGHELAEVMVDALVGVELDKATGAATRITDATVSTDGQVLRVDGRRKIEVRAAFDTDDLSANLTATEAWVEDHFGAATMAEYGLAADALAFDYGQESDFQDDFASLGVGGIIAVGLMALLLLIQFRSFVQVPLILLAIPFSFFGMFSALAITDNSLSFFVVVGLIALVGVVVNNTILLIDAANQNRRDGMRPGAAIGDAVTRRFRPLVATTLTTVVGLVPLAAGDPFWEAFGYTLIGGLLSSTVLVLLAFPVFYLAVEKVRTPVRNAARRRLARPEI